MRIIHLAFTISLFLFSFLNINGQFIPKWCETVHYNKDFIAPTEYHSSGLSYLLSDVQINLISEEYYTHIALKITEENGLAQASSITLNYDSTYQTAKFLAINIIRNGTVIDILKSQKPEILRREQYLEFGITDGSLTSYLEVKDLQVGDILEYRFITKGFNPILKDYLLISQNTSYDIPIGKLHINCITDKTKKYKLNLTNNAPTPIIKEGNNTRQYIWDISNPRIIDIESDIPSWYYPIPTINISPDTNWESIAKYVLSFYKSNEKFSAEYETLLDRIKSSYTTKSEQARYAIQYVQNNIYYLGNEEGIYSIKPRHPNLVLKKKSGDCKEKSWLLTCLLNDIGYEAYSVLVNTFQGHVLDEKPISLAAFNHCVNCLIDNQDTIYIDPTITNQGGNLNNIFFPNYEKGLLIKNGTTKLSALPLKNPGESKIEEIFNSNSTEAATRLDVKTIITGRNADFKRTIFKNISLSNIQNEYLKSYANRYSRIDTIGKFWYKDDIEENRIEIRHSYIIDNFWNYLDSLNTKNISTTLSARSIQDILRRQTYPNRKSPLALIYPLNITQTIIANLPYEWRIKNEKETISGDGFNFSRTVKYHDKELYLNYNYKTTQDHINSDDYLSYLDNNKSVFDKLNFNLWYNTGSQAKNIEEGPHPFFVLFIALIFGICIMLAFKGYKYNPEVAPEFNGANKKIRGWVLIPSIGIIIWTLLMFVSFLIKLNWGINSWLTPNLNNSSSTDLLSRFALLIGFISIIVFGLLNSILFIKKRSSFPKLMIAYFIYFLLFTLLVSTIMYFSLGEKALFLIGLWPFINCCIWIPYFLKSKRVMETFTNRIK
ncbi:DUF3857 domain-containing protein [Saccharicrinis aurantiacus]|uniref:DUF3857 domain-containing protein n=1 Tax=Saccharicrinis aurantiacus TaxID=1849719 RepID=UPI002490CF4B|nr:DUF3857 domain-containing protein [Saccharicrinis aurantiacus]